MSNVAATLQERGSRYGEFADHAKIAQGIQDVMRAAPKWDQLDLDMKQALSVIADKIARILNGDPFYLDNWHDISGYSTLIENRLNMIQTDVESLFENPMDAHYEEIPEEAHSSHYYDRNRDVGIATGGTTFSS